MHSTFSSNRKAFGRGPGRRAAGVQETSDAARVINLATQQQRTATEQVVASMAEIEDVTRQTTQASKQATGAAAELTQLAGRLAELIKRFKAD